MADTATKPKGGRLTTEQRKTAQDAVLAHLRNGVSITAAADAGGVSPASVHTWRKTDPTFKAHYEQIKKGGIQPATAQAYRDANMASDVMPADPQAVLANMMPAISRMRTMCDAAINVHNAATETPTATGIPVGADGQPLLELWETPVVPTGECGAPLGTSEQPEQNKQPAIEQPPTGQPTAEAPPTQDAQDGIEQDCEADEDDDYATPEPARSGKELLAQAAAHSTMPTEHLVADSKPADVQDLPPLPPPLRTAAQQQHDAQDDDLPPRPPPQTDPDAMATYRQEAAAAQQEADTQDEQSDEDAEYAAHLARQAMRVWNERAAERELLPEAEQAEHDLHTAQLMSAYE